MSDGLRLRLADSLRGNRFWTSGPGHKAPGHGTCRREAPPGDNIPRGGAVPRTARHSTVHAIRTTGDPVAQDATTGDPVAQHAASAAVLYSSRWYTVYRREHVGCTENHAGSMYTGRGAAHASACTRYPPTTRKATRGPQALLFAGLVRSRQGGEGCRMGRGPRDAWLPQGGWCPGKGDVAAQRPRRL